jgi:hypothetical protein
MQKILGLLILSAAALAGAHGSATANHGGIVQTSGETWLELVVKGDTLQLYLQDDGDDMPTAGISGKLTLVKGAARSEFALKPAGGNLLEARAPGAVKGAKVLAVLTLDDRKTKVSTTFEIK